MKRYVSIMLILLLSLPVLAQNDVLDKQISFGPAKLSLTQLINSLSEQTKVRFTYGNNINLTQQVTVNVNSLSLREALDKIFKPVNIDWEILGDQIALLPGKKMMYKLSGTIKDSDDKSNLQYVSVGLKGTQIAAYTDFEGKFKLQNVPEGKYVLVIHTFAYATYEQAIEVKANNLELAIELSKEAITLFETIITSDKIIERSSPSQMELNDTKLQWSKGISNDPLNSLSALPGVLGRVDIYGSSNLHIRGGESFENQFLLDNIKLTFPFYSIGQSVFNPDMIEKAEVLTGGYSPNYGHSMSSVFNLSTKSGDCQKFKSNVDVSVLNNSALLQGPLIKDKLSFIVGVRKNNLDVLTLNDHSKAFFMGDVTGKITYILTPKTKLSVTTLNVIDNLDFTNSPDFRLKLKAKNNINAQNFQLQSVVGNKTYSKTSFLHSGLTTSSKYGKYFYNTANNTYGLREDVTYYSGTLSKIKVGAEFNIEDDRLNVSDVYRATDIAIMDTAHLVLNYNLNTVNFSSSMYAFYDGVLFKRTLLNVGARADYNHLNKLYDVSPRITLGYELTRSTLLSASWGVFNQAPLLFQLNRNTKLRSNQCQHSIISFKQSLLWGIEARVEAYYKNYDNLVMFDKNFVFSNTGYGVAKGLEFFLKKEKGNFNGWISYALAQSDRRRNLQDKSYAFFFDQRNSVNIILNYSAKSATKKWLIPYSYSLDFRYASGSPYTPIKGLDTLSARHIFVAGSINSLRNPAYNNLNLKIVWLLKYGSKKQHTFQFYMDFWNILSTHNLVARQYTVNKEEETFGVTNNYAAKFYPNFGLRFNFNTN
jgi:hypothetical protein